MTPGASDCAQCGAVLDPADSAPASQQAGAPALTFAHFAALVVFVGMAAILLGGWVGYLAAILAFVYALIEHFKAKAAQKRGGG